MRWYGARPSPPICFLLPSLIFFLGFVIYPMILCVVTSFFDSTMNRADIFVGLANYKNLFQTPSSWAP